MKTVPALARGMRRLRAKHGLTQAALAERVGVGTQYVSELERGTKTPSVATLDTIAAAFKVAPWELLAAGAAGEEPVVRAKDALATRIRAVIDAWPEDARTELLDVLQTLGRLGARARRSPPRRAKK